VIDLKKKEVIEIREYPIYYADIYTRMKEIGMSKTYLCKVTGLTFKVINKYCNSEAQRVDLDVISRICAALDCNIENVIKKDE